MTSSTEHLTESRSSPNDSPSEHSKLHPLCYILMLNHTCLTTAHIYTLVNDAWYYTIQYGLYLHSFSETEIPALA